MHLFRSLVFTASKIISPLRITLFSYGQKRQSPNRLISPNLQTHKIKSNPGSKIDPSYWQSLLSTIQPSAVELIKALLNPKFSQKQINRLLQQYLQFRNLTFTSNQRTDRGCMAVLAALSQSNNSQNTLQYQNRIVDYITLSDIKLNQYDGIMLKHFLIAISKRINTNIQKNIRQYYRLKLVDIMTENFERFEDQDLLVLIKVIEESIEKDKLNFITLWRFYPLFEAILTRTTSLMQSYTSATEFETRMLIDQTLNPFYLSKIISLIYHYDYIVPQNAQKIYNFIIARDTSVQSQYNIYNFLFNALCYLPYTQIQNPDGTKITLKKKLLGHFEVKYKELSSFRKFWNEFPIPAKRFTIQRFLSDQFHTVFKSLPFKKHQDKYLLLKKQHLMRPQVPDFIWQLFKQNEKGLLDKTILKHCITRLYRQKVSLDESQWPQPQRKYIGPSSQNQANLKIWQALEKLGYEYKKQQICGQRQVDIVIKEQIIIQIDGQGHYMSLSNEICPQTSFRNLHLLLSGYKLIVISMFEYNNHRQVESLQKLIQQKVQLVFNHGYVYVC